MIVRGLGGVLLTLWFATPVAAQDPDHKLKREIDFSMPVRVAVTDCTVPKAVTALVRRFELLAGIEYMRSPCSILGAEPETEGPFVNLRGLTVEDALAKLVALDSRYRLAEHGGVLVLRPVEAWGDAKNSLNFTASTFELEDVTLGIALDAVVGAMVGEPRSTEDRFATATEQGSRRFSVKTGTTSAGAVLEAIVRAHGAAWWEVREGEISRLVSFYTFDGSGMGTSRRGLQ